MGMWMMVIGLVQANCEAPKAAVEAFVAAADAGDAAAASKWLHPEFRVVFRMGAEGDVVVMDRASYLGLMKDGKVGGSPRKASLRSLDASDGIATVRATLTGNAGRFESTYTVTNDSQCLLLQDATVLTVSGK